MTARAEAQPQARPVWLSPTRWVLAGLVLLAVGLAAIRFMYGIGPVSNMNNAYPWGIWISFDLLCGVALAAGAFTTCAAVHILNLKQFRPLTRPAVLTGFLGYLMVIIALLVDLGRPERIWYMLIHYNLHSPLFEVGLCVMTYTTVLFLEFSPLLWEWLKWEKIGRAIHSITLPLILLGTVLSTLHQSSLGSLFLVMRDKLDPLWHSPLLPVFFFLSAATAGLAMVVVEGMISAYAYDRDFEWYLLSRLVKPIPWLLGLLLALKLGDLAYAGELQLLFRPGTLTALYWAEIVIGMLTPMILLGVRRLRTNPRGLKIGATLVVLGLVLNRLDVGLIALKRPAGATYFPSWMEIAVSAGIIAAGVLVYDWVARHLRLFESE